MADNNTPATDAQQEELMKFPMLFPIKIMGLNNPTFPGIMCDLAGEHFDDFDKKTLNISFSKTKKYMALTITVNAQSKEQLDKFYMALTQHPMVKVAL